MINILVCDDDSDIVSALRIFLTAQGYGVVEAHDGAEAISAVLRGGISLCLLDIMMPGTDGLTALAAIRRESNVPVILLTAKSEDGDKILGLDMGADDYVTKPFNPRRGDSARALATEAIYAARRRRPKPGRAFGRRHNA